MDLKNKVAIVTGAGKGIGRELALTFSRHGMKTVICSRTEANILETAALIQAEGGDVLPLCVDVSDEKQVNGMVQAVLGRYQQIDLLFNNAGSFKAVGPLWEVDPSLWWQDVTTNLRGVMLCCQAVLPHMMARNQGIIINMDGGGGSHGPNVGGSGYGCSKAAVVRLTEGLAHELRQTGSAVLAFCMNPGFVWTGMTQYLADTPERRQWQPHVPLLRDSDEAHPPADCAKATLKLLHIASPELTGRVFYVDTDYEWVEKNKQYIENANLFVLNCKST